MTRVAPASPAVFPAESSAPASTSPTRLDFIRRYLDRNDPPLGIARARCSLDTSVVWCLKKGTFSFDFLGLPRLGCSSVIIYGLFIAPEAAISVHGYIKLRFF